MATSQQVWYAEATAHYIQYYKNNYGADVLGYLWSFRAVSCFVAHKWAHQVEGHIVLAD